MSSFQIWTTFLKIAIVSQGLLTHGHADAIGALPYLLAEAKVPVFGSELTIELAKLFVKGMMRLRNSMISMSLMRIRRLILEGLWFPSSVRPTLSQKVWVWS